MVRVRKKKRQAERAYPGRAYHLNLPPEFVEADRHPAKKGGESTGSAEVGRIGR